MQVYDVEGKKFGAGDKIMFQKNDKLVGVKNGQTGTIKSIDDQGNAKIRIGWPAIRIPPPRLRS